MQLGKALASGVAMGWARLASLPYACNILASAFHDAQGACLPQSIHILDVLFLHVYHNLTNKQ